MVVVNIAPKHPSGVCTCDRPSTAHEVRRMHLCARCGDPVLDGHKHDRGRLHTRCAVAMLGLETCVTLGFGPAMRLCCLGEERMTRLMDLVARTR